MTALLLVVAVLQARPPLTLAQPPGEKAAPIVITLKDALERAKQNDQQFLAATADADVAHDDRVQARASLLPAFSYSLQYLGNSPTPGNVAPNGRFVSLDGVNMYRNWAQVHQDLSANVFLQTPVRRASALEAVAQAKLEIAQRGLVVTVTTRYYALVVAERKYADAQHGADQAARFLQTTQSQERLGQAAHSDAIKAEIASQQQVQAVRDAMVGMDAARLSLAVLLFPALNENFTVVDDLASVPALPEFTQVQQMAAANNPDVRAAEEAAKAAGEDVRTARNAFFPTIAVDGVYGFEANQFATHAVIADKPELGSLPTLGYFITVNMTVPVWDWGNLRSKLHSTETRQHQAQVTLTQTQRQLLSNLYSMYNEALAAKAGVDNTQHVADLAAQSLRLMNLRYQAGESTALEVVDAQNTLVQARNAVGDAHTRYRVALAELQTLTGQF
jgi:outer membrane protein TolC